MFMEIELVEFTGFPRELPEFLLDLKVNNTAEKLEENKEQYVRILTGPLKTLHNALIPTVMEISPAFDLKPSRCVSSMYTDRRFTPEQPLREYVYLRFKVCGREKDIPGLYFDMGIDYFSYGMRIYKQTSEGMSALRENILKNVSSFNRALAGLEDNGFMVKGITYRKDHYPEMAVSPVKELLNCKFFYVAKEKLLSNILYTNRLAEELKKGFSELKELFQLIAL